jgi:phosphate transport system substrate-binding protein
MGKRTTYGRAKTGTAGIILLLSTCISCTPGNKPLNETPTRGNIHIVSDDSYKPLIDTEVFTFTHLYQNAHITPIYKPEFDVISDFMDDSVQVIVTSMRLTDEQKVYLRTQLIETHSTTVAYDALALMVHRQNPDTMLTYESIRDIFLGKITDWKQLNPKSRLGNIKVVFDNTKSANIRYFKEKFDITTNLPGNFYALQSHEEVINYISRNPDGLGVISVNWISDTDDSLSRSFIDKVQVVAISQPYSTDGYYYRPSQGWIYDKTYPFTREVYMISRESIVGLGSGFISWVAGAQGQRIILKSGLVPATMPVRLIQVKNE